MMENKNARDWACAIRIPSSVRFSQQFDAATVVPFVAIWALAWWVLSCDPIGRSNRLYEFTVFGAPVLHQHDCGHGTLFKNKSTNDWIGRILGAFTLTPYEVWRRAHSIHHGASGNLTKRGIGDIDTLTASEYQKRSRFSRLKYRLYRHPITLFIIGPACFFHKTTAVDTNHKLLDKRDGNEPWDFGKRCCSLLAWRPCARFVHLFVTTFLAAIIGVWLFYVQHQFEYTIGKKTQVGFHDAALHGSSRHVQLFPMDDRKCRHPSYTPPFQSHPVLSLDQSD